MGESLGLVLDGTDGTARVVDTDDGALDTDADHDSAVGPMQFLPGSWSAFGGVGNEDGDADSNSLYDGALGAARHLCEGRQGLENETALAEALRSCNHSDAYVQTVLGWVEYYDQAAMSDPTLIAAPTGNPPSWSAASASTLRRLRTCSPPPTRADLLSPAAAIAATTNRSHSGAPTAEPATTRYTRCRQTNAHRPPHDPDSRCMIPRIDFTCGGVFVAHADPCFRFLTTNAASFGLYNLATEPWHWSTTGR